MYDSGASRAPSYVRTGYAQGIEERDGQLWGRGATDMKSGVAAFVAAAVDFVMSPPAKEGAFA